MNATRVGTCVHLLEGARLGDTEGVSLDCGLGIELGDSLDALLELIDG